MRACREGTDALIKSPICFQPGWQASFDNFISIPFAALVRQCGRARMFARMVRFSAFGSVIFNLAPFTGPEFAKF